jgi:hypothetical protein
MTPEEAITQIRQIMYPAGRMDAEWSSDELPLIAEVLAQLPQPEKVYTFEVIIDPASYYCRHGVFIGDPYGPDYLCGACESGDD